MDYKKVDPGLAGALEEAGEAESATLPVFIHTVEVPDEEAIRVLKGFGVAASEGQVFTGKLSPRAVDKLSEQPWVQSIKLSRSLRALKDSGG